MRMTRPMERKVMRVGCAYGGAIRRRCATGSERVVFAVAGRCRAERIERGHELPVVAMLFQALARWRGLANRVGAVCPISPMRGEMPAGQRGGMVRSRDLSRPLWERTVTRASRRRVLGALGEGFLPICAAAVPLTSCHANRLPVLGRLILHRGRGRGCGTQKPRKKPLPSSLRSLPPSLSQTSASGEPTLTRRPDGSLKKNGGAQRDPSRLPRGASSGSIPQARAASLNRCGRQTGSQA